MFYSMKYEYRLLTLAASFATKMVRQYGLAEYKKEELRYDENKAMGMSYLQPFQKKHNLDKISNSRRLLEMARFLEVIRNIQSRLISKTRRLDQAV